MTQNLKIEVVTETLSESGHIVTNLVTKEELSQVATKKADLGSDGKIPTSQLPENILNTSTIVGEVKAELESTIQDAVQEANAYAESYVDDIVSKKADLGTDGKISTSQLPKLDQYSEFKEKTDSIKTELTKALKTRTDELEFSKASLDDNGKVLREQLPEFDQFPGVPELLDDLSTRTVQNIELVIDQAVVEATTKSNVVADNAAARAEAAAVSANIGNKVYSTPADGVKAGTGVPVSSYFNVRSPRSEYYVDEYLNRNGVPEATGKSYPSAKGLQDALTTTGLNVARSEAAATAAAIGGKVYATAASGVDPVTGVADGAYFNVRSSSDESYVDEYQNVGGVSTPTGKRYLSALGVELQEKSASTIKDPNSGKFQSTVNLKIKKVVSVSEYGITGDGSNEGAKLTQMFSDNPELGTRFDFQGLTVSNDRIHLFDKRHKFELFNGAVISVGNTGNFTFRECRNYKLTDFVADGNRANQTPAESATKHNVKIFGGENFAFSNVDIINGLCENLYIGISLDGQMPKRGYFNGIVLDNSYRNNLGIIDGADVFFDNYEFTNANGTSPQAGIDLESNDRTGATTISDIRFGRGKCTGNMGHQVLITQYGNPKDIDLGEMIISAPRDSLGGIFTFASLNLSKVTFKDFKGTQYTDNDRLQFCIRTGLPENFINLSQVKFMSMADGVQGIRSHSSVVGTRSLGYVMNGCEFDDIGNNFLQPNFRLNIHKDNIVRSCRGTWLVGDAVSDRYIEATDNHLFNCTGRAISSQTEGAKIENNHVYDCLHASSWMQVTGFRSIVNGNKFFSETPLASSVRALIVNSSIFSFQDNYADANFTSTSALYNSDAGTTRNVGIINRNNVSASSTSDGVNITRSPQTLAKFTTANRPAANAVPSGTHIYDTTLQQELVSNGTVWLLPNGAKSARGSVTWEPGLLAAGETKSTTLTVAGASVGDIVVYSFSRDLLGCRMWPEITATDTAKVFLHNPTSANITIASGTVLVKLI